MACPLNVTHLPCAIVSLELRWPFQVCVAHTSLTALRACACARARTHTHTLLRFPPSCQPHPTPAGVTGTCPGSHQECHRLLLFNPPAPGLLRLWPLLYLYIPQLAERRVVAVGGHTPRPTHSYQVQLSEQETGQ